MLTLVEATSSSLDLRGESQPGAVAEMAEIDLWLYRARTVALLRRYGHVSVEVGRLPSLLGREFFRSRLTPYSVKNFEDAIVFVTDMERSLAGLSDFERKLLAMNILEEYTVAEISTFFRLSQRTIERLLRETIDELSRTLLGKGLLDGLPGVR
jgi:DNA-directed RNA polymerase specialized sigma24 family protein